MAAPAAVLQILVNANTKGAIAQLTALDGKLKQTETKANTASTGIGKKLVSIGKVAGPAMAAGVGFALFSATKKTMEFDAQLSSLQAVTKANRAEMKRFEKQAVTMGAATVFSATEAAQAQIELAKGGLTVKQIMGGGLNSALALAAAGELALADAASVTVNAMKLFGIEGRRSMQVADMLATAANKTTADVRDFAMALTQGGSVAKQAGYSLNETVVVLEALAEAGVKNSDAGTSMKAAFVQLLGPTEKQKDLADSLGLSFVTQSGRLKNAAEMADTLRNGLRGMSDAQRAATLKTLAGTDGFRTLAALYDAGSTKLNRFSKANREQGTAAEMARQKNNNLRGDLEQLSGAYETLQILIGKKVTPTIRQATQWVTQATNAISGLVQGNRRGSKAAEDFEKKNRGLVAVLRVLWGVVKTAVSIMKLFTGVLFDTGNTLKRLREIAGNVGQGMKAVFSGAWLAIRTTFREGANAVIGIVNSIIGVLNKIPGVDIGEVGIIYDPSLGKDANGPKALGRQRGGPINIGKPSGDSVPTMLERGEYVLNRKAVRAVGRKQLDAVNFGSAPRFQKGGMVGMISGGDVWDAAKGAVGKAAEAAGSLAGKGAGFFINMLPDPNIPQPFTGVGPWAVGKAKDFIKNRVEKLMASAAASSSSAAYSGPPADFSQLGNNAWVDANTWAVATYLANRFGSSISSNYRSPAHNAAVGGVPNSSHTRGTPSNPGAFDFVPANSSMQAFVGAHVAGVTENMIHDVGSGLHNHVAFFRRGGLVQKLAKGGLVEKPWFNKSTKKGNINGIWPSADLTKNPDGWYALPTLPPYVFGALAEAAGRHFNIDVPGKAMMQMVMHEGGTPDGGKPGSRGTDPGGTVGYGPWAVTTKYNDALVKRFGGSYGAMNNPVLNAAAMAHIVKDRPDLSAWYGDKYVTDKTAHWKGSYQLRNALGGVGYSAALRSALTGKPVEGGGEGMSPAEEAKQERKARRKSRYGQVEKLLKAARNASSVQGKKGAYWQILDLFAKFGDFDYRKASTSASGGVVPAYNQAADFLSRAGRIAAIADPNRGAGQLYSLVGWLQDSVDLTGVEDGNDRLAGKLAKVKESGKERAKAKRQKKFARIAKYGTDFPWKNALNKNASRDEVLDDWLQILSRDHQSELSEFGSEYSPAEIAKERDVAYKLFVGRDNRYRMLMNAIAWAEKAEKFYKRKVEKASKNPGEKWLLPGYKKGLSAVKGLLSGGTGGFSLRDDLKNLVGAAGVAGVSVGGGTRGDAYSRWLELSGMKPGGLGSSGISIGDLRGIIEFAALGGYANMPKFHDGGIVPGVPGQERPAMVMPGEGVFTPEQMAAMGAGNITINVKFRDDRLKDLISFEIDENNRAQDQQLKGAGV